MALLVAVAFVAGMVTAISPCVLPALPILFAGSATGSRRRPLTVVTGLVLSFTLFTLAAAAVLAALGLPKDTLRWAAIGVVALVGVAMLWPRLAHVLERPFLALGRRAPGDAGGGFLLGVSLGLLFTPCAGPVIGAVATVAATRDYTLDAVLVTFAYALGAGAVLLGVAFAARRSLSLAPLRRNARTVRAALGVLMVAAAGLAAFDLDARLAANVPSYTKALQALEESASAQDRLDDLLGAERLVDGAEPAAGPAGESALEDYGLAPELQGISAWINSPPLTLAGLRGKVVVVDFWTYSCVNCLRTLPFLRSWWETYRDDGLVIVGVHTPEFAFEADVGNVREAARDLEVTWPVALDAAYETWNAWGNRYWPAKYFVDRRGHVRYFHFGEGAYEESEAVIRRLLAETADGLPAPVSGSIEDATPTEPQTPETYLGYQRLTNYVGSPIRPHRMAEYELPAFLPPNGVAYGGRWLIDPERITAGAGARLVLSYRARAVHLVLGTERGPKRVQVYLDGRLVRTVRVVEDRLYTLARTAGPAGDHELELRFEPGTQAYAFTFG